MLGNCSPIPMTTGAAPAGSAPIARTRSTARASRASIVLGKQGPAPEVAHARVRGHVAPVLVPLPGERGVRGEQHGRQLLVAEPAIAEAVVVDLILPPAGTLDRVTHRNSLTHSEVLSRGSSYLPEWCAS